MKLRLFSACQLSFLFAGLAAAQAQQQPIGTVGVQDATVAGALEVSNGRAILVGNTTVTARDRTAEVDVEPRWHGARVRDQRAACDGGQRVRMEPAVLR